MTLDQLKSAHTLFFNEHLIFYTDIFCDDIWGDMGIDCASVELAAEADSWKLHYIRTQSGWLDFAQNQEVTRIIDEYTKTMNHEELYMYIQLHGLQPELSVFVEKHLTK